MQQSATVTGLVSRLTSQRQYDGMLVGCTAAMVFEKVAVVTTDSIAQVKSKIYIYNIYYTKKIDSNNLTAWDMYVYLAITRTRAPNALSLFIYLRANLLCLSLYL